MPDKTRLRMSGSWLYWVAGVSLVNMIVEATGSETHFALGLGVTSVAGYIGSQSGGTVQGIAIAFTLVTCALLIFFGYQACRGHVWSFGAGIVALVLDTLLLFIGGTTAIISIIFHVWAIFSLVNGLKLAVQLQKMQG